MDKKDRRLLRKRYLIWLYKTVKEELDRTERRFTQLEVDHFLLRHLRKKTKNAGGFSTFLADLERYIRTKEEDAQKLKFSDEGNVRLEYQFLSFKLEAIEKAIRKFLGRGELAAIKEMYEKEMIGRIISERQHKT